MCASLTDVTRLIAERIAANRGASVQETVEAVLGQAGCDGPLPRELVERHVKAFLRSAAEHDERQLDLFKPGA